MSTELDWLLFGVEIVIGLTISWLLAIALFLVVALLRSQRA
jgi:hypothetical protein